MSSQWQRPEPDPFARVWAEVKKIRAESAQRVNYLLRNAGLRVAEGALHVLRRLVVEGDQEVTGSIEVSGDAAFTGDTAIGGRLDVTGQTAIGGATTISGDTDVTGDLEVTGQAGFGGTVTIRDGSHLEIMDGGRIRVKYPQSLGGDNAVYFGRTVNSDTGEYTGTGLLVERPNGDDILNARINQHGTAHQVIIRDNGGEAVLWVSESAPRGLTRPTFSIPVPPSNWGSWAYTNQASWTRVCEGYARLWHGRLWLTARAIAVDGATAGEIRVRLYAPNSGAEYDIGAAQVVGTTSGWFEFEADIPSGIAIGDGFYIRLEGRVTSGAGELRAVVVGASMTSAA